MNCGSEGLKLLGLLWMRSFPSSMQNDFDLRPFDPKINKFLPLSVIYLFTKSKSDGIKITRVIADTNIIWADGQTDKIITIGLSLLD